MGSPTLPEALGEALIPNLPASGYYIPNFISEDEEAHLLSKINAAPLPTWKNLSHRRLQAHPSTLSGTNTLLAASMPIWLLNPVVTRLLALPVKSEAQEKVFGDAPHSAPNHCLINEYLPGQGIHAHEDGDAYFPLVATVSLGSHVVLEVKPKEATAAVPKKWRVLQERRSLLITTAQLYTECLHGIDSVRTDEHLDQEDIVNWNMLGDRAAFKNGRAERGTRVSLTFRDVLKVKKLGKAFGGLHK